GLDQAVARGERGREGLLEQRVLARLERGDADLFVQVVGHHDVDRVDVPACEERAVVEIDDRAGEVLARGVGGLRGAARDGGERGAGRLGDGARVMAAEEPVADEAEAHHPFSAPATSPRTTYFCSSSTSSSVGSRPRRQMAIMSVKKTK